jgi:hypothetical protein
MFLTGGKSSCYACPDGSDTAARGSEGCNLFKTTDSSLQPTSSSSTSGIVAVCQFKAPYQLSEITDILRGKMVAAIASLLEVSSSIVVLGFSSVVVRRRDLLQQAGVLVSVGLNNFHDSVLIFATRITQEKMNTKMAAEGLMEVQLMAVPSAGTCSVST